MATHPSRPSSAPHLGTTSHHPPATALRRPPSSIPATGTRAQTHGPRPTACPLPLPQPFPRPAPPKAAAGSTTPCVYVAGSTTPCVYVARSTFARVDVVTPTPSSPSLPSRHSFPTRRDWSDNPSFGPLLFLLPQLWQAACARAPPPDPRRCSPSPYLCPAPTVAAGLSSMRVGPSYRPWSRPSLGPPVTSPTVHKPMRPLPSPT